MKIVLYKYYQIYQKIINDSIDNVLELIIQPDDTYWKRIKVSDELYNKIYSTIKEKLSAEIISNNELVLNAKLDLLQAQIDELKAVAYDDISVNNGIMDITNVN